MKDFSQKITAGVVWHLRQAIGLRFPGYAVHALGVRYVEEAVQLLTRQFCEREPLSKYLGIQFEDVIDFFRLQVEHVAKDELGLVVLNAFGQVVGALTVEDHLNPFQPDEKLLTPELKVIFEVLEALKVSRDLGFNFSADDMKIYYCGIAAVKRGEKAPVLAMMILGLYPYLMEHGYTHGYAKVTHPKIVKQFKLFEQIIGVSAFHHLSSFNPATLRIEGDFPLKDFKGEVAAYAWPMQLSWKKSHLQWKSRLQGLLSLIKLNA